MTTVLFKHFLKRTFIKTLTKQMNVLAKETFINNDTFSDCLHSMDVVLHAHLSPLENMLLCSHRGDAIGSFLIGP